MWDVGGDTVEMVSDEVQSSERGKVEASGLDRDRASSHDAEAMAGTSPCA